jgi:hypothetical protein
MLFKEIIAIYREKLTKPINTKCSINLQIVKSPETYNCHSALKALNREGLRKAKRNVSQHNCSAGRHLNLGPPKYDAGV